MLGTWNTTPLDLELKDDADPVFLRTYSVPRVHEAMFKKESKRLMILGLIEEANGSEWGAPYFSKLKLKTNRVRFLSDFWNLNRSPILCQKYVKCY